MRFVFYSSSSSRSSTGACLRKREEKEKPWRGAGAGGGKDVGVAPAVGVRGSTAFSRGLSPESNRSQTAPNGRCYHYTTKPSRVKDAGARLVGCGVEGLRADIPRIIVAFDIFLLVLR